MPNSPIPAAATGLPLTREQIEQHVEALIDLLDTLDADPDLEPDCGRAENIDQANANHAYGDLSAGEAEEDFSDFEPSLCLPAGTRLAIGARYGDDAEEDAGDEGEIDHDAEWELGWTDAENQASPDRLGHPYYAGQEADRVTP